MKVFLVDDSIIIRQRLKRMLANVGDIEIAGEAGEVHEAMDAILLNKPDVILLDIHLLGGSGIDVLETVKKAQPAPAVIVLTNYPYPQYRQKCLEASADFFFIKSTEFDEVVPALKRLGDSHQPPGNSVPKTGAPLEKSGEEDNRAGVHPA